MKNRDILSQKAGRRAGIGVMVGLSLAAVTLPTGAVDAQNSEAVAQPQDKFETHFEEFTEVAEVDVAPNAVDISEIDPPREIEEKPEPKPEPKSRKRGRSLGTGVASYYGKRFHGRLTANGERFNMNAMTAAHKTLPFGTKLRVTNTANGKSVIVRINDRGPFIRGRMIDLSRGAAQKIGLIHRGHGRVKLEII